MRAVFAFVLSFVASTWAYTVLTPSAEVGWTNEGPQNCTWTRVDTDAFNFTALLTNQQIGGFTSQVLAALVDGTTGFAQFNPPENGGFMIGADYRLDFVKDTQDLDTILAQSDQYNITAGGSSTSSTGTIGTTATASLYSQTGTSGSSGTTGTGTTGTDSSGTSASVIPTTTSGAASSYPVHTGLLALFSLLGLALA